MGLFIEIYITMRKIIPFILFMSYLCVLRMFDSCDKNKALDFAMNKDSGQPHGYLRTVEDGIC